MGVSTRPPEEDDDDPDVVSGPRERALTDEVAVAAGAAGVEPGVTPGGASVSMQSCGAANRKNMPNGNLSEELWFSITRTQSESSPRRTWGIEGFSGCAGTSGPPDAPFASKAR